MTTTTIEELIEEVHRRGLFLNNLYELGNGRWQANVTDRERYWEFGRGETPVEAIIRALHMADHTEPEMGKKQQITVHKPPPPPKRQIDVDDLVI